MEQKKDNSRKLITVYDKREQFEKNILPTVQEIMSLCSSMGIPAFMTFAVANSEEGTVYERRIVHAIAKQNLKDDALAALLLKLNGFDYTYPDDIQNAIRLISSYLDRQQSSHLETEEPIEDIFLEDDEILSLSNFVGGNYQVNYSERM